MTSAERHSRSQESRTRAALPDRGRIWEDLWGKWHWRSKVCWVNLRMPSRGQGREARSMDKAAEAAGLGLMWLRCSIMSNSLWPPWTLAHKAPLSMGFFQQEYWSGLPFLSPGDLPDPGIGPMSLMSPVTAGRFFTTSTTWEALGPTRLRSTLRTWDSISRSVGSHRWAPSMESTVKGDHSSGVDGELEVVVYWSELARHRESLCASQLCAQAWCW